MRNLYLTTALLLTAASASAQTIQHSRLLIGKNQKYVVGPENVLHVDTLVMEDKAIILFSPETTGTLKANVAIVGNKCTITSRGANGSNATGKKEGTTGQDGGDLTIEVHFVKLGSLLINTRGGKGGDGVKGRNGARGEDERIEEKEVKGADGKITKITVVIPPRAGTNGTDATTGLNGGSGGNIHLTYSSDNFIPVFNNSKARNSIMLLHTAGDAGRNGEPGKGGISSIDGKLIQVNSTEPTNGEIRLINARSKTSQH